MWSYRPSRYIPYHPFRGLSILSPKLSDWTDYRVHCLRERWQGRLVRWFVTWFVWWSWFTEVIARWTDSWSISQYAWRKGKLAYKSAVKTFEGNIQGCKHTLYSMTYINDLTLCLLEHFHAFVVLCWLCRLIKNYLKTTVRVASGMDLEKDRLSDGLPGPKLFAKVISRRLSKKIIQKDILLKVIKPNLRSILEKYIISYGPMGMA